MPTHSHSAPRKKLDPRLQLFLILGRSRLHALKDREERQLAILRQELTAARQAVLRAQGESEIEAAQESVEAIQKKFFAPLTSGYFEPKDLRDPKPWQDDARSWKTDYREPYLSASIVSSASAEDLRRLDVTVRARSGDVFTALIPISKIESGELERLDSIRFIGLSRPLFQSMGRKSMLEFTGIETLQEASGLTGQGVIVGVIDTWLDLEHPDLRAEPPPAASRTRVLRYWDQTTSTLVPTVPTLAAGSVPYGRAFDDDGIQAALVSAGAWDAALGLSFVSPPDSHGTMVTGCAAGGGLSDAKYRGTAPGADIIFVRCKDLDGVGLMATSDGVQDAVQYIFDRATELNKPCVVNLSYNDHDGPHDGTTETDLVFEEQLGVGGRAITISAGNSNSASIHLDSTDLAGPGPVPDTDFVDLGLQFVTPGTFADIWYAGAERFRVEVQTPGNPATLPTVDPDDPSSTFRVISGTAEVDVLIQSTVGDPRNGDNFIRVTFVPVGAASIPAGDWTIRLKRIGAGGGVFHAWVKGPPAIWRNATKDHCTLGEPATGSAVITVGAHGYEEGGGLYADENRVLIRPDSGCGPSRRSPDSDKPDLVALGTALPVILPLGGYDPAKDGTSLAAPLVAGACALLFDSSLLGPAATCALLKGRLRHDAGKELYLGAPILPTPPNDKYGDGYLKLESAVLPVSISLTGDSDLQLPTGIRTDVWVKDSDDDKGLEPFAGSIVWVSRDIRELNEFRKPRRRFPDPMPRGKIVEVVVRNRGRLVARNVDVYLYTGGPSTDLPFPEAWSSRGIATGTVRRPMPGNRFRIPKIHPGKSATARFLWSRVPRRNGPCAEDHDSFLARVECPDDPSLLNRGGRVHFTDTNNFAVRNVLVRKLEGASKSAAMTFLVPEHGSRTPAGRGNSLHVQGRLKAGQLFLELPIEALPWRDLELLEKHKGRLPPYGAPRGLGPAVALREALVGADIQAKTDVVGAARLEIVNGVAILQSDGGRELFLPRLQLAPGAVLPVTVRVAGAAIDEERRCVHATHSHGGRRLGGVTLELSP